MLWFALPRSMITFPEQQSVLETVLAAAFVPQLRVSLYHSMHGCGPGRDLAVEDVGVVA